MKNLFATSLTHIAPSANYRGESLENRSVMQKITIGRHEYPVISPEAIRNAIREILSQYGLPCNRKRLNDEEQLAVRFEDFPDADQYVDDFFMGWLVAAGKKERKAYLDQMEQNGRDKSKFQFRRDSVLRMNMAVALEPFRHATIFTQSPQHIESPWKNADSSQLLHRETAVTAFQYPFALNLDDCSNKRDWTKKLLKAIGELNGVAGNHARSYYEMAPASIVVRLTSQLVAGYNTYGFDIEKVGIGGIGVGIHRFHEVVEGIKNKDFQGSEFYLGGKIVRDLPDSDAQKLREADVTIERNPQKLLEIVASEMFS